MASFLNLIDNQWRYKPVLWLMVLLVCVFFLWASLTTIDQQVRGVGRVIPAGKSRVIQHLEGGIVQKILVKEGQQLERGAALFIIKNERAESELREAQVQVESYRIKKMRLDAESENVKRTDFKAKFAASFTPEIQKKYQENIVTETRLFNARRQGFFDKISGLQERLRQKQLRLSDFRSRIKNLRAELRVAEEKLAIKKRLRDAGAVSRSVYLEVESEVKSFNTRIAQVQKEIPITTAERDELMNLISETQQIHQTEIIDEISGVESDIKRLDERIRAMADQVQRTEVVSPVRGVVNKLYMNTIGGVVQPGAQIAEIIPLDETLIVEGRIRTDDRGKIWPGLRVVAQITAYDYSIYGGIDGELTYISADSFITKQNEEFYQIRATLEANHLGGDKMLFPGMTVEMNIIAGEISVLQAIMKPFRELREKALREL